MNSVLPSQPFNAPHLRPANRTSPTRSWSTVHNNSPSMSSRKRKADDDGNDERMSTSPSNSPSMASGILSQTSTSRNMKRLRTNLTGRALPLPRLLETLNADEMRNLLQTICERNPQIGQEVVSSAPRASVGSALGVLGQYEATLQSSFPFGGRNSSDYSYNRVRQPLINLLDALKDYTPHFLPPNEAQATTSLQYLDGATEVIHRLPNWDTYQANRHKQEAYEEMAKAWAVVFKEAAKRAGGIQLQNGGWDAKITKHDEISGGRMREAVDEMRGGLVWMSGDAGSGNNTSGPSDDVATLRQQLLNGTYGIGSPVQVGTW